MDRRNFEYMFYGFTAAWLVIFIYLLTLVRRANKIRGELLRCDAILRRAKPGA